jgi:hypothetical protein
VVWQGREGNLVPYADLSTNGYRVFVAQRNLLETLSAAPPGGDLTALRSAIEVDLPLSIDTDIANYSGDSPVLLRRVTWAFAGLVEKGLASITNLGRNPAGQALSEVVVTHLDGHGEFRMFCESPNREIFEHTDAVE